jgi:hypothetical protein
MRVFTISIAATAVLALAGCASSQAPAAKPSSPPSPSPSQSYIPGGYTAGYDQALFVTCSAGWPGPGAPCPSYSLANRNTYGLPVDAFAGWCHLWMTYNADDIQGFDPTQVTDGCMAGLAFAQDNPHGGPAFGEPPGE